MSGRPIYLDNFATTPLAAEARYAMESAWDEPGNAGSPHAAGARAAATLERSRGQVANLIGSLSSELTFTSGATEANNLAIRGIADWARSGGSDRRRIIVSSVEHKAVIEAAESLASDGFKIVKAPVHCDGIVDLKRLEALIDETTLLVSIMLVNNETGAIQPVARAVECAHAAGALFHCDGAQAVGKLEVDVVELGVDYLSISAHKLYGPMGIGALYIAASAPKPFAQQFGGGQERGLRSGTEPVPLIAGFGAAAEVARRRLRDDAAKAAALVLRFCDGLGRAGVAYRRTTGSAPTIAGSLSLAFPNVNADDLVSRVGTRLSISTGSACTSGRVVPSHVLISMQLSYEEASSVVRLYFSRYNTSEDAERAAIEIADSVGIIRLGLDEPSSSV